MTDLDERLQRLARSVELPSTAPEDDLARGRARRRHRHLGVAAALLTTATVIGTSVILGLGGEDAASVPGPGFAGASSAPGAAHVGAPPAKSPKRQSREYETTRRADPFANPHLLRILAGYRDVLRDHLDPAGVRLQTGSITNEQTGPDTLGTKLGWNGGGMLAVAVGRTLEGVQFFCDGGCTRHSVPGSSEALVLASRTVISVAVFQDDGDIVALTADTSFGNNGTSTSSLGVTAEQLLAAAADPRLDLPDLALLAEWTDR